MTQFDAARYKAIEREVYTQKAQSYEQYGAAIFESLAVPVLEAAQLKPEEKVLDVACGMGIPSLTAAKLIGPNGALVGIDLAPGMVDLARTRATRENLKKARFQEADAETIPFPDDSFDVVLCHLGLIHFTDRVQALSEMHRVLKPDGRVVLSVWSTPHRTVVIGIVAGTVRQLWPAAVVPGAPTWFDFGREGAIEGAVSEAGFKTVAASRFDCPLTVQDAQEYWQTNLGISGRLEMLLANVPSEVAAQIAQSAKNQAEKWRVVSILRIPCEEIVCWAQK